MNKTSNEAPVGGGGHARFVGSIPHMYDTYLGPLLFEFSGADLARRVAGRMPGSIKVLELACGTGISTGYLRQGLDADATIVATDLNDAMLDYAREKRGALANVNYQQADAQDLPFDDGAFDVVVCQFGIMFMPDKAKALSEMFRVLRPGGLVAFNVWDSLQINRVAGLTQDTIASFFEVAPPDFLSTPFGFYQIAPIRDLIAGAGFADPEIHTVSETVQIADAITIARGFVEGTPAILQIRERGGVDPADIVATVAEAIQDLYGRTLDGRGSDDGAGLQIPLQEIVFLANRT